MSIYDRITSALIVGLFVTLIPGCGLMFWSQHRAEKKRKR